MIHPCFLETSESARAVSWDVMGFISIKAYISSCIQGEAKITPNEPIHNTSCNAVLSDMIRSTWIKSHLIQNGTTEGVSQPLSTRLFQLWLTGRNFCAKAESWHFLSTPLYCNGKRLSFRKSCNRWCSQQVFNKRWKRRIEKPTLFNLCKYLINDMSKSETKKLFIYVPQWLCLSWL